MTSQDKQINTSASEPDWDQLTDFALLVRRDIIKMLGIAASGHPGGSLSVTDILVVLYSCFVRHDPKNPKWPDRDRVIFSKGHGCPALYSVLARIDYFDPRILLSLRQLESPLQGHPDMRRLPGIEISSGSLGQGLSVACGSALAARLDKKNYWNYTVISDGELNEGQIWEAAAFASFQKLPGLITIIDCNKYQLSGRTKDILDMEPILDKWKAFGWAAREVDGHRHKELFEALNWARAQGRPSVILAHTIKGKGVSFMENNNHFHGVAPNKEETQKALIELDERPEEIQRILGMFES